MFGTSGIRGTVGETVTADLALAVGRAVATDGAETVVLGRDVRDSGRFLADAAAAGCAECGADVIDLGLTATPTLARSIARLDPFGAAGKNIFSNSGLHLYRWSRPSASRLDPRGIRRVSL